MKKKLIMVSIMVVLCLAATVAGCATYEETPNDRALSSKVKVCVVRHKTQECYYHDKHDLEQRLHRLYERSML